jgi:hypothetical protein
MSQDDHTLSHNAPNASRRALLFGIAAVGAVASPAVAASLLEAPKGVAAETLLSVPAPAVADPIFDVIRQHLAAQEELLAACKANGLDIEECPRKTAAMDRAYEVEVPLFTTRPTTLLGAASLLEYVHSEVHQVNGDPGETVMGYASGYRNWPELEAAIDGFDRHIIASLRAMRGQA